MQLYSEAIPHPAEDALPTLPKLGNPEVPSDVDASAIAAAWMGAFGKRTGEGDVEGILELFVDSSYISSVLRTTQLGNRERSPQTPSKNAVPVFWRDVLAVTWDFRTFEGIPAIREALRAQLDETRITNVKPGPVPATLDKLFDDLVWIQLSFTFETKVGLASGIARLVPLPVHHSTHGDIGLITSNVVWKAQTLFTNLEDLKGFPESIPKKGELRPNDKASYEQTNPTVLVIGGGHCGLDVAARLKALQVETLIIDKHARIGDSWRLRYDTLALHTTLWHDHRPYIPRVANTRTSEKLADWLEAYANTLGLDVWSSAEVIGASQDQKTKLWMVKVRKSNGHIHHFKVKYIVMATGFKGGKKHVPQIPGMQNFRGQMLHSFDHKSAKDRIGKKVVLVGSGTSAHDIGVECADYGIDVTMIQRGPTYVMSVKKGIPRLLGMFWSQDGPPTQTADLLAASVPFAVTAGLLHRQVEGIAEDDKDILEGLEKVGFRLNMGFKDSGLLLWVWSRASGYYIDVGGSKYVVDGKIRLKNDSPIKDFTETGVRFENGDELPADVVVFCTGLDSSKHVLVDIFGDDIAKRAPEIWGVNSEGEQKGTLTEVGFEGLYVVMGDMRTSRFYSKHIAMQIKATEEGIFNGNRYSSERYPRILLPKRQWNSLGALLRACTYAWALGAVGFLVYAMLHGYRSPVVRLHVINPFLPRLLQAIMSFVGRYSTVEPHPSEIGLPTLSRLGNPTVPDSVDPDKVAAAWLNAFGANAAKADVDGVLDLIVNSSFRSGLFDHQTENSEIPVFWRDLLSLTWDLRTFEGTPAIRRFLQHRLSNAKVSNLKLGAVSLDKPFPDIIWIQLFFTFETNLGLASGIARLLPIPISGDQGAAHIPALRTGDVTWKAFLIFTNLDDLKDFPENIGSRRSTLPNHGKWEDQRQKEVAYENREPAVLIIGGGQSGLDVAARLKALGVDSLVVEKNKRIGDNWRSRYEALCLHDPVWYDHMPYLPFPQTWPVYTPAKKLANWLEAYVDALELNVWTSSKVISAVQDPASKIWAVTVKKEGGTERIFKVKHIVMAIGLKGGKGYVPEYPGMDRFKGEMLHAYEHKKATDHLGKKVVVIGAATSAHDICVDYVDAGIDVTMFQRSPTYVISSSKGVPLLLGPLYSENGPPTDVADRLNASFPMAMMTGMGYRGAKLIAELDKDTLDGLHKAGFKTNLGIKDTGFVLIAWTQASGYYLDVGGSQYIIDGKIKLKNDSLIKEFTETGLKFENGSELQADVVVFCTGLADTRHSVRAIFGDDVAENTEIYGLNEEGEFKGLYREIGYKGLYAIMGNLALCRFYSKHIALQIKAAEEGLFDSDRDRYTEK